MTIEHARICGACERECPGWADRCPACGSLSLLHRITFVPAAAVPAPARAPRASAAPIAQSSIEPSADALAAIAKPARKSPVYARSLAARDAKVRKTPLGGEPETRAV